MWFMQQHTCVGVQVGVIIPVYPNPYGAVTDAVRATVDVMCWGLCDVATNMVLLSIGATAI